MEKKSVDIDWKVIPLDAREKNYQVREREACEAFFEDLSFEEVFIKPPETSSSQYFFSWHIWGLTIWLHPSVCR